MVFVAEKGEIEPISLSEVQLPLRRVATDADDLCLWTRHQEISHVAALLSAAGGICSGIEVQQDRFTAKVRKPNHFMVLIEKREVRSPIARLELSHVR